MAEPHRCPVCLGKGIVPAGFYLSATDAITVGSTAPETCKSCQGSGIVRGKEPGTYVVPQNTGGSNG